MNQRPCRQESIFPLSFPLCLILLWNLKRRSAWMYVQGEAMLEKWFAGDYFFCCCGRWIGTPASFIQNKKSKNTDSTLYVESKVTNCIPLLYVLVERQSLRLSTDHYEKNTWMSKCFVTSLYRMLEGNFLKLPCKAYAECGSSTYSNINIVWCILLSLVWYSSLFVY